MSTTQKARTLLASIPFCFNSNEEALTAESAVNKEFAFPNSATAFVTNKTLFVPEHPSRVMRLTIDAFVRARGGRRSNDC